MIRFSTHLDSPDRRGRAEIAITRALSALLTRCGSHISPEAYHYIRRPGKRPELHTAGSALQLELSLSHCGEVCVACVEPSQPDCRGMGIDLERWDRDHEGLLEGGFSTTEQAVLNHDALVAGKPSQTVLRAWCGKEAVVKALGTGFEWDPLGIECVEAHPSRFKFRTRSGHLYWAYTRRLGPWILAKSYATKEDLDVISIPA